MRRLLCRLLVVSTLCLVPACSADDGSELPAVPTTVEPPSSTTAEPSTTVAPAASSTTHDGEAVTTCSVESTGRLDDEVYIFALCDGAPAPLVRRLPQSSSDPIAAAMELLIAGTTEAERDSGLLLGFDWVDPAERERVEPSVSVSDGVAVVAFEIGGVPWTPGNLAGTSSQLFAFLWPVEATLFQFPWVEVVDLGRLCWGEMGCDSPPLTRDQWESQVQAWEASP